jgi:hypothetical protein
MYTSNIVDNGNAPGFVVTADDDVVEGQVREQQKNRTVARNTANSSD